MDCPKCKTERLAQTTVRGVEVDRCAVCGGIWCDQGELDDLLELGFDVARKVDRAREDPSRDQLHGQCPRDGENLLRIYSARDRSIVLDACARCSGIWLDAGELQKLSRPAS